MPGSPAIDAGNNALVPGTQPDRARTGFPRIVNTTVDIGAFESGGFTVDYGGKTRARLSHRFQHALTVHVTAVNAGEPTSGGTLTYTAPGSPATATLTPNTPVTLDANGNASVTATANGTVGTSTVTATTAGVPTGNQASFNLNNQLATTTSVTPSVATSVYGDSVTFTATVHEFVSGNPVTTGSVTFMDGSTPLPGGSNIMVDLNGQATYITTTPLSATNHTIAAFYSGASVWLSATIAPANRSASTASPIRSATRRRPTAVP